MVKIHLEKYSEAIESLNEEKEVKIARRDVELFFSFDIVNSSAYKTLNYTGWYNVIICLFKKIQQNITKMMPSAEMWRILGDEVIFIVPIKEKKDFYIYTDKVFEILNKFVFQLREGTFFDDLEIADDERALMKMQNILSLKAAAWVAIVGEGIEKLEQYDNLLERYKLREGYGVVEFLGNDIDAGFRIKRETQERRMVISFELAYILSKDTDYLKNINIISYKGLKGIWQNRLYPIIWYHDSKYVNGLEFEDSFFYDEKEGNSLVQEYFKRYTSVLSSEMYDDVYLALNKIAQDQKLENKLEKIFRIIQESQNLPTNEGNLLEPKFLMKLHCVAVCFDQNSKRILIMKRSDNKSKYAGLWEFGCAKGTLEASLCNQIEKEYMDDFGIKIKVLCDQNRKDKQPVPLALYETSSEQGRDKGIITLAKIVEPYDTAGFKETEKHSIVRWITEEEVAGFEEKAVMDFKDTLIKSFRKITEIVGDNYE